MNNCGGETRQRIPAWSQATCPSLPACPHPDEYSSQHFKRSAVRVECPLNRADGLLLGVGLGRERPASLTKSELMWTRRLLLSARVTAYSSRDAPGSGQTILLVVFAAGLLHLLHLILLTLDTCFIAYRVIAGSLLRIGCQRTATVFSSVELGCCGG